MPKVYNFTVLPALPDSLRAAETIARNMFWSWQPQFVELFRRMDGDLWSKCGHNPIKLLAGISQERLEQLAKEQGFLHQLAQATEKLQSMLASQNTLHEQQRGVIAYFSTEFGIHECLPIYAGGLGVLAADHLKSASDLGVPMVGIGLLYQRGYFRQYLNIDGWQQEVYSENDFYHMPIELVRKDDGQPATISVEYPDRQVSAQIWCVALGRVKLYLLDTNVPINSPADRMITASLYGGDCELRIRQEIMLGIGGVRALNALNITPAVFHLNEGHTAFLAIERIRQLQNEHNLTFDEAVEAVRSANIFTMHTPVKAGLDEFPVELMDKYFGNYIAQMGISREQFLALGRILPDDDKESFKMPILAIRTSSYINGVSKLHGQISRQMWGGLWPGAPVNEVPITSITNGVHIKSWLSDEMNRLYERYLPANWADEIITASSGKPPANIQQIPDEEIWQAHQQCKQRLIIFARNRLKAQMQRRGTYHSELNKAQEILDFETLTIGFARRFAGYKRANLLLKDPARLTKLLTNPQRPIQIIFAGKAHPRDKEGKEIIRQIIHFANQPNVRRRIVFLEDYDIDMARVLVQGVDVWLNNPRRPMEASGTSGMKAAINGALNISTLDGWWCEAYSPQIGWVIGAEDVCKDTDYQDMIESQAIYNILENEVIPLFYTRSSDNLPRPWIRRMKNSIQQITARFNTHRMVSEYTQRCYIPAANRSRHLTAEGCSAAKALSKWKSDMKAAWPNCAIKDVQMQVIDGGASEQLNPQQQPRLGRTQQPQLKVGSKLAVSALIKLGSISPEEVSVQLYYGPIDSWGNIKQGSSLTMDYKQPAHEQGEHWFAGWIPCTQTGQQGLAVRVLPKHPDLVNPYELGLVLWETTPS